MTVRLLRAWYFLRELVGLPRRLDESQFDQASATVLLAGSPWTWTTASTSSGLFTFAVSNTTWSLRIDPDEKSP